MNTYSKAKQLLAKVGAKHAQGDALRAMYAKLALPMLAISERALYEWLRQVPDEKLEPFMEHWLKPENLMELAMMVIADEPCPPKWAAGE